MIGVFVLGIEGRCWSVFGTLLLSGSFSFLFFFPFGFFFSLFSGPLFVRLPVAKSPLPRDEGRSVAPGNESIGTQRAMTESRNIHAAACDRERKTRLAPSTAKR